MKKITVQGVVFQVKTEMDDDAGEPWDRECGHGPVRIVKANFTGYMGKRPGERVLVYTFNSDGWAYDFAEAAKIARRDGWGLNESDAAKLAERLGREPTRREVCAEAARLDMERMNAWLNDDWSYVGVTVTAPNGETASVWGIESDSGDEFIDETARDLAEQLAEDLPNAVEQRAREAAHAAMPARLALALAAMKRCPGVDTTDQETGETFRTLLDVAIERFRDVYMWEDTQRDLTEAEAQALAAIKGAA